MVDIRAVSEAFAVAPQLMPEDLAEVARLGFRLVINNRPDGETPDQPSSATIGRAVREAGMDYLHAPVRGMPSANQVEAVREAIETAHGPALAFCKSGTRSIIAWALGERAAGRSRDELIRLGRAAGYDLSGALT